MGLPIWVEPSESKPKTCKHKCSASSVSANNKPTSDPTTQRAARSTIRRQPSVRYPNGARPRHLNALSQQYLRGSIRSPPPALSSNEIPPVPSLPSQTQSATTTTRQSPHPPSVRFFPPHSPSSILDEPAGNEESSWPRVRLLQPSPPASGENGSSYYGALGRGRGSRSRHGTMITTERRTASPSAIDDLPPLRRMGHRSINDARSPQPPRLVSSNAHGMGAADFHRYSEQLSSVQAQGLGDRDRSISPDADQWETLLTTITPDPSLPSRSAETSFNSAATSFPSAPDRVPNHPNSRPRVLRPIETPLSPLSQPRLLPDLNSSFSSGSTVSPEEDPCEEFSHRDLDLSARAEQELIRLENRLHSARNEEHSASPALHELDQAVASLSSRCSRLVRSFASFADSMRHNAADENDDNSVERSSENEIRALASDLRVVQQSLENSIRERAQARAQRVSLGSDPMAGIRNSRGMNDPGSRDRGFLSRNRSRSPRPRPRQDDRHSSQSQHRSRSPRRRPASQRYFDADARSRLGNEDESFGQITTDTPRRHSFEGMLSSQQRMILSPSPPPNTGIDHGRGAVEQPNPLNTIDRVSSGHRFDDPAGAAIDRANDGSYGHEAYARLRDAETALSELEELARETGHTPESLELSREQVAEMRRTWELVRRVTEPEEINMAR